MNNTDNYIKDISVNSLICLDSSVILSPDRLEKFIDHAEPYLKEENRKIHVPMCVVSYAKDSLEHYPERAANALRGLEIIDEAVRDGTAMYVSPATSGFMPINYFKQLIFAHSMGDRKIVIITNNSGLGAKLAGYGGVFSKGYTAAEVRKLDYYGNPVEFSDSETGNVSLILNNAGAVWNKMFAKYMCLKEKM